MTDRTRDRAELLIYYAMIAQYFFAFGLQFVIFPALVTFVLQAPPAQVGYAQTALSMPMFVLLLIGGLIAERTRVGATLAWLYGGIAAFSLLLALIVMRGWLTYPILLLYAVAVGSCAALLSPARDSALNGVVERAARAPSIATAAAVTTAVQIGAQIGGIIVARSSGANPAPFLIMQAVALAGAAGVSLFLRAPKPPSRGGGALGAAIGDLKEGLVYAFKNPVMGPMLISAFYSGVFVIGSFQVLLPLIVREDYGGDAQGQSTVLGFLFAAFWATSFVSAVILTRLPPLKRPGQAMLISHMIGAATLLSFVWQKPLWAAVIITGVWGLAAGVWISLSRTIAQSASAPRFLGRVLAIYSMGFMGGAPIGSALTGWAAALAGPHLAAILPGAGLMIGAVSLALFTSLWRFDFESPRPA